LGLTKSQVAKAVATFPPILGFSIEQNLKPTVQWFVDLGMTETQVAKAVAAFPQILGYSVRTNLNSKLQWLLEVGLNKTQVAKAVASSPQMLGLSLENNLKKKLKLMKSFLTRKAVAQQLASFLPILLYRYKRLDERLTILALCNQTSKLAGAMTLTDEKFKKRYMT
jgi:mTERF domain-containing protein